MIIDDDAKARELYEEARDLYRKAGKKFIGLVGGAASWPFAARAQQASRMSKVGVFGHATTRVEEEKGPLIAFRR